MDDGSASGWSHPPGTVSSRYFLRSSKRKTSSSHQNTVKKKKKEAKQKLKPTLVQKPRKRKPVSQKIRQQESKSCDTTRSTTQPAETTPLTSGNGPTASAAVPASLTSSALEVATSGVVTAASSTESEVKRHRHLLYPDFHPPTSPFKLVQEQLYKQPWKLLVATIFLNRTTGVAAKPILWEFFRLHPTPEDTISADPKALAQLFQPLGLHNKRAAGIIRFSEEYLNKDWVYPKELYGIGKYGNDSYRIFCTPEWREVRPTDHWLNKYYAWLCTENDYHPSDWNS